MQKQILKRIYKRLLSLLDRSLSFEIKVNGIYRKGDVLESLIRAQTENTTVESACRRSGKISSDDVFYHLNKLSIRDVTDLFNENVQDVFTQFRKKHRIIGKVDISVDIHEIPFYGKDINIFVLGGKHKAGTNKFYKIITLCIVSNGKRYTLAVIPISFFDITVKLLEQLVLIARKYVEIRYIFMDRAFLSIDIINKVYQLQIKFITPIKRNDRVIKIMKNCFLGSINRTKYTMKSGNKETKFDLVLYKTNDDLVGFATNIQGKPERIARLYSKRWGIETSYRVKNQFCGRTCSRKSAIRLLFIMLSFMLYNLWVLANRLLEEKFHVTAGDMCLQFVRFIENGIP